MPIAQEGFSSIYYEDTGRGAPILCLQGLGAAHSAWSVQAAYFRRGFRCILPDNRDTGQSTRSDVDYDLRVLADDALSVLDSAGVERTHVVGLSMGAGIAQELALTAPDRVRSLTLLSAFARPDARIRAILENWQVLYESLGGVMFHRQSEPWLFSPAFFEQESNLRALRRYVEADPHPQEAAAFARQVGAALTHDTSDRLRLISVPTLAVSGELDTLVPWRLGKRLAEGIPGARFELLPDVAHSVNLEGQRPFNRLLESFLSSVG